MASRRQLIVVRKPNQRTAPKMSAIVAVPTNIDLNPNWVDRLASGV
jgi:hypothetical protein